MLLIGGLLFLSLSCIPSVWHANIVRGLHMYMQVSRKMLLSKWHKLLWKISEFFQQESNLWRSAYWSGAHATVLLETCASYTMTYNQLIFMIKLQAFILNIHELDSKCQIMSFELQTLICQLCIFGSHDYIKVVFSQGKVICVFQSYIVCDIHV